MSDSSSNHVKDGPPPIRSDPSGHLDTGSLADVIQWFLDYDPRVSMIKHGNVEELFQWKQRGSRHAGEEVFNFNRAEDRLAIGIIQALAEHPNERELHGWISQLLNALEDASKVNEEIATAYKLASGRQGWVVTEAGKIPAAQERAAYLTSCWIEVLCTAEVRVLGWIYQDLYGRPFHPATYS